MFGHQFIYSNTFSFLSRISLDYFAKAVAIIVIEATTIMFSGQCIFPKLII